VNGPSGVIAEATAVMVMKSGVVLYRRFKLASNGNGSAQLMFGRGKVARVILVMGNAGIAFSHCWANSTVWSCSGVPVNDRLVFKFSASQR
jgi:hypothetical protein